MLEKSQKSETSVNYAGLRAIDHAILGIWGIFRALQCLVHLMPQNFGFFFRALQCLVYLRATKHRNARKFPKFWGMRCTNLVYLRAFLHILLLYDFIALLLHFSFTLLLHFSHTQILYYSISVFIYYSFSLLPYYFITLVVYL